METSADRSFGDELAPSKAGRWSVKAFWDGDVLRLPSESGAAYFTVELVPKWPAALAAVAAVLALIVVYRLRGRR